MSHLPSIPNLNESHYAVSLGGGACVFLDCWHGIKPQKRDRWVPTCSLAARKEQRGCR